MIDAVESSGALSKALANKKVVLCLGSGGVGKTTASAALALAMASTGERVVVLTIDPARRLADALGQKGSLGNEPTRVEGSIIDGLAGEVWAAMLDPAETFEMVVRSEADDDVQAERILSNRLFVNLTTSLSGTNEYMAAERLHQLHHDGRFDRVIIDTPPSHHAMDFLDSPGRLTRFVDHRLYRSVFAPRHQLLRPLNVGTRVVMRVLARLVGSSLVDDVVTFFADFEGMDAGFRRRASEIEDLLAGPDTAYLLVAAARRDRLEEAKWILGNLERRHRSVDGVIVNRVLPFDPGAAEALAEAELSPPLARNLRELASLARQEAALIDRLRQFVDAERPPPEHEERVPLVRLGEQLTPVHDLTGLVEMAKAL